jgi:glycosyltransferase involved in cell wall biosynthesis
MESATAAPGAAAAGEAAEGAAAAGASGAGEVNLVILNQYYAPDVASTGHLLHELATELARRSFRVKVITSRPSYGPRETWQPCPLREMKDGVAVHRMITTRLSKDRLIGRVLNSATFVLPLMVRVLLGSRREAVHLYTTNPPFLGIIGAMVSMLRRHTYVLLLHDAYPQIATWTGTIRRGGVIDRLWHAMNRLTYRRAARTIVLCHAAKRLVCGTYGVDPSLVHVIHNWADGEVLVPKPKARSRFAREHGLVEPFTAMYSGNLGLYYEFDTLLAAAERLRGENFRLVLIGSGGRRAWLAEQIEARGLSNTLLLPYQPTERLPDSLTACDASFVTIARGIEGISFPSKLYSALAVGRPVLVLSEEKSELRDLVLEHDLGRWFNVGDAEGLAQGIREMMRDPARTAEQGRNARAVFDRLFTRGEAARQYAAVLRLADRASRRRAAQAAAITG